jgi:hypothetical protein
MASVEFFIFPHGSQYPGPSNVSFNGLLDRPVRPGLNFALLITRYLDVSTISVVGYRSYTASLPRA